MFLLSQYPPVSLRSTAPLGKGALLSANQRSLQTPICLLKSKQAWQKPYFRAFAKLVYFCLINPPSKLLCFFTAPLIIIKVI